MRRFLDSFHARVGDLWWYSLMIFVACRSGDVIQAFIGLWLVPKYVGTVELGAVMPLQNLSGFFAMPLAVLAAVFAKFVNIYAAQNELRKVKSLIQWTISIGCTLFLACSFGAFLLLPFFYERLRIAPGLLSFLILFAGAVGCLSSLFTNALQGLKSFTVLSVTNVISAPLRLITLLIAMPFRPLSGYVLGQTTPSLCSSLIAFSHLRRKFASVIPDSSWRSDLGKMLRYALPMAVWTVGCSIYATFQATIIRQRLPEVESAAFYMFSKFAELAGCLSLSLFVVLFPLASESHETGDENRRILHQSTLGTLIFSLLLTIFLGVCGKHAFGYVAEWRQYLPLVTLLVPFALSTGFSYATATYVTYEMACNRFLPIWIVIPMNLAWLGILASLMGIDYYVQMLPANVIETVKGWHMARLDMIAWLGLAYSILQFLLVGGACELRHRNKSNSQPNAV